MLPTVISIPGVLAAKMAFRPLYASIESAGFHVAHVPYASACKDLDAAADATADLLLRHKQHQHAPFSPPVHFVTHGAGALVLRRALQQVDWEGQPSRIVMLGPPNRGSQLARKAAKSSQLWRHTMRRGIVAELGGIGPRFFVECGDPPSSSSVLVIAGTSGGPMRWLPDVVSGVPPGHGPHDGAVFVKETLLRTPHTLLRLPCSHLTMPMTRSVIDATTEFLRASTPQAGLERAEAAAKKAQVRVVLPWLMAEQHDAIRLETHAVPGTPQAPAGDKHLLRSSPQEEELGERV